jgi:3-dehydroquinate dehydratase type I
MDFDTCLHHAGTEPFVEFRFDLLDFGPAQVISLVSKSRRCIATCRPGKYSDKNRFMILQTALEAGAEFVDLDIESDLHFMEELTPTARSKGCDMILSHHDFQKTPQPEELERIVQNCRDAGADLIKIACQVNQTEDLINLFHLYRHNLRLVVIGMGEKGIISRVAAPFLGAEFTFASVGDGHETAPGQISKDKLDLILEQIRV